MASDSRALSLRQRRRDGPGERAPGRRESASSAAAAQRRRDRALGAIALGAIVALTLVLVVVVADRPSPLSAVSRPHFFPGWLAGPLGGLLPSFFSTNTLKAIFTAVVVMMYGSYLIGIKRIPLLGNRWLIGAIVAVQLILLLAPPLALTDVFNYIDYARMEVVHNLNPYATIPVLEPHSDPAYALSNWHQLLSPYGPLFTIFTFAAVPFGVPASFWLVKGALALLSLAVLALIWKCARMLGIDQRRAVIFAGLNPIVLLWGLGGDHNDFAMVALIMLAVYLLLRSAGGEPQDSGRVPSRSWLWPLAGMELAAGFSLAAAVFVKASAAIVVPVVIAGLARAPRRAVQTAIGGLLGAVLLGLLSYLAFGAHIPDLGTQGSIVTDMSIPNLLGVLLGQGGETATLRIVLGGMLVVSVALCCVAAWRSGDWITASGWATVALLATLAWVLPWYVIWVLPLAALSRSRRLRIATVALGVYLIMVWAPAAPGIYHSIGFVPANTPLGQLHHRYVKLLLN